MYTGRVRIEQARKLPCTAPPPLPFTRRTGVVGRSLHQGEGRERAIRDEHCPLAQPLPAIYLWGLTPLPHKPVSIMHDPCTLSLPATPPATTTRPEQTLAALGGVGCALLSFFTLAGTKPLLTYVMRNYNYYRSLQPGERTSASRRD